MCCNQSFRIVRVALMIIMFGACGLFAQPPLEVVRRSDIAVRLDKKQVRPLILMLLQGDEVRIRVSTKKRVNFRITNADGLVLHENLAFIKPAEWSKSVTAGGAYTLTLENVDQLLPTELKVQIELRRPRFVFGSGIAGSAAGHTLLTERSVSVLTDGRVQITAAVPRKYPYALEKGDTLEVRIKGLAGPVPFIEVSNEQKELLFAALPERRNVKVSIPVLESGKHEILLYSKFLTNTPLFPMYDSITITRTAPTRYAPPVVVPVDSASLPRPVIYDTIPEVMMDSVFFLGAVRDFVHPSEMTVTIPLGEPDNILFWAILYGAGREFEKEYDQLKTLIEGKPLAAGATDPLAAFGLGYLRKLPEPGNPDVQFYPSGEFNAFLDPPVRSNYGIVYGQVETPYLLFENRSKSVGHNVYVKVVVFRRAERKAE